MSAPEVFRFLAWAWDISKGHQRAAGYPVHDMDVSALAGFATLIHVDPTHLDEVDLSRPILLAPVPELDTNLVIDGWHRVHRALRDRISHLPARLLTEADEAHIRIRP